MLLLRFCDVGYRNVYSTKATDFCFQVEQKLAGLEGHLSSDKQKQGTAGNDRDSIRASILDEAVIVCKPLLMLRRSIILLVTNCLVNVRFSQLSASVARQFSLN